MYRTHSHTFSCLSGHRTGLVVDSGASMTTIVPVLEGCVDPAREKRLCVAGDQITQRLGEMVQRTGPSAGWGFDLAIERMKIRCCYTAVDLARETAVCPHLFCA
jgi:actin-related protein